MGQTPLGILERNMNIPQEIQDDLITYLEAARVALSDADVFDGIADQLDLADHEMLRLRKNLEEYLSQEYLNREEEMNKKPWFVAEICRIPTNFNQSFRVAIEADDREHASKRLYKLYPNNYGSPTWYRGCLDAGLQNEPAKTTDDLDGAIKHPLPTDL